MEDGTLFFAVRGGGRRTVRIQTRGGGMGEVGGGRERTGVRAAAGGGKKTTRRVDRFVGLVVGRPPLSWSVVPVI